MRQDSGRHLAARQRRRRPSGLVVAVIAAAVAIAGAGVGGYSLLNRRAGGTACASGRVTLRVVADPDQAGLLQQVAEDYARTTPVVGDRCVDVAVRALDSPEAVAALASGWADPNLGPAPDVWVPASSLWASELDLQLEAVDRPSPLPADRPSVATSPLVVAMPRPMAQALGWPRQHFGWSSLIGALRSPEGWRAFGRPEWGQFRLGKTDPGSPRSAWAPC